jgi:hypothetical protein
MVGRLLRQLDAVHHRVCPGPLTAAVVEGRLIRAWSPPFNQRAKARRRSPGAGKGPGRGAGAPAPPPPGPPPPTSLLEQLGTEKW